MADSIRRRRIFLTGSVVALVLVLLLLAIGPFGSRVPRVLRSLDGSRSLQEQEAARREVLTFDEEEMAEVARGLVFARGLMAEMDQLETRVYGLTSSRPERSLRAFEALGPLAASQVKELDAQVRRELVYHRHAHSLIALMCIGEPAGEALYGLMTDPDKRLREVAFGEAIFPSKPSVQTRAAMRKVARLVVTAPRASRNDRWRKLLLQILILSNEGEVLVPQLLRLAREDSEIAEDCLKSIARFRPEARRAFPAVLKILDGRPTEERIRVLASFIFLGAPGMDFLSRRFNIRDAKDMSLIIEDEKVRAEVVEYFSDEKNFP